MKTEFEKVYFKVIDSDRKLKEWNCYRKKDNDLIGDIEFFNQGNQYYYFPRNECYFGVDYLEDILTFMHKINNPGDCDITLDIVYKTINE